jgi:translocation protein SEC63
LVEAKLDIAPAAVRLIRSFHSITLGFGNTLPLIASMRLSQNLIQAIPPGHSPLLQIPYFTRKIVDAIERDGGKNHWNIHRVMSLPEEKRKKLCVGKNLLTVEHYNAAMTFARNIPSIRVESAFFKVMGEKFITPVSLVNFVLKMRIVPPGSTPPPVDPKDLLDDDPEETDVDALLGRKAHWSQSSTRPDESSVDMPSAHAPFYPRDHNPSWFVFLADFRQGKLVVPPQAITSFDRCPDNFAVVTAKMQFQAPQQAGEYTFTMMCVTDSYLGIDIQQQVNLVVSDPSKVSKIEEVDDISDPDEGKRP